MKYQKSKIISNQHLTENIYKMVCTESSEIKAGQFYMLRLPASAVFLPRPISVCSKSSTSVTFLYADVGKGTHEFSQSKNGDEIELTGPLGNGFNFDLINSDKIALVTGGIGIAPMLEVAKQLRHRSSNITIDLYAGFRNSTYLIDEMKPYLNAINISTDSGLIGHHGFVTEIFDPQAYGCVLCCGPEVMMKRVTEMCLEKNTEIFVSMERHMACGVGACLACTCKTTDGVKRTCADGPVFAGKDLIF